MKSTPHLTKHFKPTFLQPVFVVDYFWTCCDTAFCFIRLRVSIELDLDSFLSKHRSLNCSQGGRTRVCFQFIRERPWCAMFAPCMAEHRMCQLGISASDVNKPIEDMVMLQHCKHCSHKRIELVHLD